MKIILLSKTLNFPKVLFATKLIFCSDPKSNGNIQWLFVEGTKGGRVMQTFYVGLQVIPAELNAECVSKQMAVPADTEHL